MPARLYQIAKGATELAVEHSQLPRYQAEGWNLIPDKVAKATRFVQDANPRDLIEVWRGGELRICTVDQLALLASLGFEPKTKETGNAEQSRDHEPGRILDEPVGDSQPGDELGGSPEVGMAGDPQPERTAEAGLDDEPPAGPVSFPEHHFKLDRPNTEDEIREAYAKLDPDNDDHWTKYGLPRLETLNLLLEHGPVTRTQLNKAVGNPVRPARS